MKIGILKDFIFTQEILQSVKNSESDQIVELATIDSSAWPEGLERVFVNQEFLCHSMENLSTEEIRRLGFYEWLDKSLKGWEPKSRIYETMRTSIRNLCPDLDLNLSAYVTGRSRLSRGLLSILAQMGFSKLNWVVLPEQLGQGETTELAEDILKYHFSLQLNVMDVFGLSSRNQDGSILINTFESIEPGSEAEEVLFFNYLSPKAICLDLSLPQSSESRVIAEAKAESLRTLSRQELGEAWLRILGGG